MIKQKLRALTVQAVFSSQENSPFLAGLTLLLSCFHPILACAKEKKLHLPLFNRKQTCVIMKHSKEKGRKKFNDAQIVTNIIKPLNPKIKL